MSGFLLDTNVPSELVRPRPEPRVKTWVAAQSIDALFMSAVSFGELRRGIILRTPGKRRTELELWLETDLSILFSGRILPVTKEIADRWGVLDATCQLQGTPANAIDGMIAATALEDGLIVVTRNVKDFAGLSVEILNPGKRRTPPRLYSKRRRSGGGHRFDDRDQISGNGDDTLALEARRRQQVFPLGGAAFFASSDS